IDGGTFSHQLDYPPSQQNFTWLTSIIAFPGDLQGLLMPLIATGPGFNGNAFAGRSTGSNTATTLNDTNQNSGSWPTNKFVPVVGTSTGGNTSTTLNDTHQNWITNQ